MNDETVLLVEGDSANSMLATAVLEAAGFHVEVAGSAAEAQRLLHSVRPRIILIDVTLPGGEEALALTRELKASPRTSMVPVSYVSSPIKTWTFAQEVRELITSSRLEEGKAS